MKLDLIFAYRNLKDYIAEGAGESAWNKTMVEPYWDILTEYAPFPLDHMKPVCSMSREQAEEQLKILDNIDWDKYLKIFEDICSKLPKQDDDTMHIAIYPSMTDMDEGIYGTGVWGNIILNINALNEQSMDWIPFVFAHEYHHCTWGDYWYCTQGGQGLDDSFLQHLIVEGEADAFAKSLYKDLVPSWHNGVRKEEEDAVWQKMEHILNERLPVEEISKYMFGNEALGIPQNAGYYYAIRIIESYLKKNKEMTFSELLKISPHKIYDEAEYRI